MRAAFLLFLAACAREHPSAPSAPIVTWLCRPGLATDPCVTADRTATVLAADGTVTTDPYEPAAQPKADCFYVYPTVDLELVPGNHEDLRDRRHVVETTLAQVGRFGSTCALWVPLYRQVTLGTWLQPRAELEKGLALAYGDVERAFAQYLASTPPGRPVVLIGHSQGAEMAVRLLRQFFERDAALRARLVLAIAVGGSVDVAPGRATGGTFASLPVCTHALETGCVVAYRTHAAGEPVDVGRFGPPPGRETACVSPAALDAADGASVQRLSRAYFPSAGMFDVTLRTPVVATPFVRVDDAYAARCTGTSYRALEVAGRADGPVDLHARKLRAYKLGLHVLDLQLAQGDLLDLVARRVARLP